VFPGAGDDKLIHCYESSEPNRCSRPTGRPAAPLLGPLQPSTLA
jgi:hypothetical protein